MTIDNRLDEISLLSAKGAGAKEVVQAVAAAANDEGAESYQSAIKAACAKAAQALISMRNTGCSQKEITSEAGAFIEAACNARDAKRAALKGLSAFMKKAVYGGNPPEEDLPAGDSKPVMDDILKDFLNQQKFVLEEIEKNLMDAEGGKKEAALDLKRVIHTMKGEAGVLGLADVSKICHAMEDYIQAAAEAKTGLDVDPLLAVKDGLASVFAYYAGKSDKRPSEEQLLKLIIPEKAEPKQEQKSIMEEILGDEFDAIRKEFIENLHFKLEELEKLIMSLERSRNKETVEGIKRIIHTMKGESGAVNLDELGAACHTVEDYILAAGEKAGVDALLKFKDFVTLSAQFYSGKSAAKPDFEQIKKLYAALAVKNPAETGKTGASRAGRLAGRVIEFAEDPDIIKEFIAEAREHLENSEQSMMKIENNPGDKDSLNSIFRSFHTIKGNASFMGLTHIKELAHESENLLDKARKNELVISGEAIEIIFRSIDKLKTMLTDTENAINKGIKITVGPDVDALIANITRVMENREAAAATAADAAQNANAATAAVAAATSDGRVSETLKVDAAKLDRLIDTIGELVITEAMVRQDMGVGSAVADNTAQKHISQLNKITRDLQDLGFGLRMISLKSTFQKMSRLVRDLAKKSGKLIEFVTSGEDTEMDKGVVERIGDPLVHMLRNAVDHGMDFPAERMDRGKAAVGKIELKAYHKSGNIHIEIADDGNGLDREKILKKAVEKGIMKEGDAPTDQQVYGLIFAPGFSTAAKVTDVSGRGVGMDVVKKTVDSLRGRIEIKTEKGKGSTFTIVLPLTLAIIEGMVVKAGLEKYIIPTLSIVRSLRPKNDQVRNVLGQGEVLYERKHVLPLFRLHKLFEIRDAVTNPEDAILIIIEDKGERVALMVDELVTQQQVVIKSLGELNVKDSGISGGAILADGRISVILDAGQIIALARGEKAGSENTEKLTVR